MLDLLANGARHEAISDDIGCRDDKHDEEAEVHYDDDADDCYYS